MSSRSRFLPYATTPHRLLWQLIADFSVLIWSAIWVMVGMAVHAAIATIAAVGRQVESGANGIADNLDSAGNSVEGALDR